MRLIIILFFGCGLLPLTSCNDTHHGQQAAHVEDGVSTGSQANSDEQSDVHSNNEVHAEDGREDHAAVAHERHGGAQSTGHADEHPEAGARDGHHRHVGDQHGRRTSHGRHHGEHRHGDDDRADGQNTEKLAIGEKVPDFEVTIDGKKWKFSELQKNADMTPDGTLVLTFWCSFCHSCRDVEHALDELAKAYKGRAGVIALDASAGETTEEVAAFARERGLTFPIALDSRGASADIFDTRVTTTTVVIDEHGILCYRGQFGDHQHAFAEDALKAVLAGEEVPAKETRQKG